MLCALLLVLIHDLFLILQLALQLIICECLSMRFYLNNLRQSFVPYFFGGMNKVLHPDIALVANYTLIALISSWSPLLRQSVGPYCPDNQLVHIALITSWSILP